MCKPERCCSVEIQNKNSLGYVVMYLTKILKIKKSGFILNIYIGAKVVNF